MGSNCDAGNWKFWNLSFKYRPKHVKIEGTMDIFVPDVVDSLNKNEKIHLPHSFFRLKRVKLNTVMSKLRVL